jgi:inhibitor of KinA sporulation pathway (predicted exonuclease)
MDESLPSLEECKKRAGFEVATVSHDALDDALDVVRLLRQQYQSKESADSARGNPAAAGNQ